MEGGGNRPIYGGWSHRGNIMRGKHIRCDVICNGYWGRESKYQKFRTNVGKVQEGRWYM